MTGERKSHKKKPKLQKDAIQKQVTVNKRERREEKAERDEERVASKQRAARASGVKPVSVKATDLTVAFLNALSCC